MGVERRPWLHRFAVFVGAAYPLVLTVTFLLLRYVGEDWWLTGLALYAPMAALGIPLPIVALLLVWTRHFRLLAAQVGALLILLFPLLGLVISLPQITRDDVPRIRVLSYNVNGRHSDLESVALTIEQAAPDLVFTQELPDWRASDLVKALDARFPHIHTAGQFLVASKYPIRSTLGPRELTRSSDGWVPRLALHRVLTPIGEIEFLNVHPTSPRRDFGRVRRGGLRRLLLSGEFIAVARREWQAGTNRAREHDLGMAAALAKEAGTPVIVVGDLNLPPLSPTRARLFGNLQDAFDEVGQGFGFTFPARHPWLRLDVILASTELEFTRCFVGVSQASDHRPVIADLTRRGPTH
jgi:vancomycin resistance protein VanJ